MGPVSLRVSYRPRYSQGPDRWSSGEPADEEMAKQNSAFWRGNRWRPHSADADARDDSCSGRTDGAWVTARRPW